MSRMNKYTDERTQKWCYEAISRFWEKWLQVLCPESESVFLGHREHGLEILSKRLHATDEDAVACFGLYFTRTIMQALKDHDLLNKKPLLTFVTKKGYWLFRVARQCCEYIGVTFSDDIYEECSYFWNVQVEVKSDRFFSKLLNPSAYRNRNIVLIDDIIHTGESIAQLGRSISRLNDEERTVFYFVFAEFEGNKDEIISKLGNRVQRIGESRKVKLQELGELSVAQVELFQSLGVPYSIDLPVVKCMHPSNRIADNRDTRTEHRFFSSGKISKSTFMEIIDGIDVTKWRITRIPESQPHMKSYYICLEDDPIRRKYSNLISALGFEMNCYIDEDFVDITLMPFPIMRSVKLDALLRFFVAAYSDTEYGNEVVKALQRDTSVGYQVLTNQTLTTALYRAVVYYLGMYVLHKFREYTNQFYLFFDVDVSHSTEHWSKEFICSIRELFPLNEKCDIAKILYLGNDTELSPEYWECKQNTRHMYTGKDVYFNMYNYFVSSRNSGKNRDCDFCSIERLEAYLTSLYSKQLDDVSFRDEITSAIVRLLNQSAITNAVKYDPKSGFVVRGFRSGENCSLILPFNSPAIFCAIYHLYQRCVEKVGEGTSMANDIFSANYSQFRKAILSYISDARIDTLLDMSEAQKLLDYFMRYPTPGILIENKEYIAERMKKEKSIEAALARALRGVVDRLVLVERAD